MAGFLNLYVERGLSKIIFISTKEREAGNSYGRETTWETVVARKGKDYIRVVATQRTSFAPHAGGSSFGFESETPITEAEYRTAAQGKEILDTPAALQALNDAEEELAAHYAKQAQIREKRAPLYAKLEKLTPKCDNCDRPMSVKSKNGNRFWACNQYPQNCDGGFKNLTAEVTKLLREIESTS